MATCGDEVLIEAEEIAPQTSQRGVGASPGRPSPTQEEAKAHQRLFLSNPQP